MPASAASRTVERVFIIVISAVSLIFAALAALGALTSVALTIQYAEEQNRQRLAHALINVRRTALDAYEARQAGSSERDRAFEDALWEVQRAVAITSLALVPYWMGSLLSLTAAANPVQTASDANDAFDLVRRWEPEHGWRRVFEAVKNLR